MALSAQAKMILLGIGMVSPIVIMLISMTWLGQYTVSLLLYNSISLFLWPLAYMSLVGSQEMTLSMQVKSIFKGKFQSIKLQVVIGCVLWCVCIGGILLTYYVAIQIFEDEIIDRINIQFDGYNTFNMIVLVLVFCGANPFLEEWYWRNFIPNTIFALLSPPIPSFQPIQSPEIANHSKNGAAIQEYSNKLEESREQENNNQFREREEYSPPENKEVNQMQGALEQRGEAVAATIIQVNEIEKQEEKQVASNTPDKEVKDGKKVEEKKEPFNMREEMFQLLFSASYASYHFIVILHISNVVAAILGTIIVAIAGRIFLFVNSRVGYIANGLAHMGADIGLALVAGIVFYNKGNL